MHSLIKSIFSTIVLGFIFHFCDAQPLDTYEKWPYQNEAVVWRGFNQEWTYNHRLNRLGNYISYETDGDTLNALISHNASTGLGTDAGKYNTYFTYLATNDVTITQGDTSFIINGLEGKMSYESLLFKVNLDSNARLNKQHVVLLNGFDICAIAKADKIEQLNIDLRDGYYDKYQQALYFDGHFSITADCQSPECSLTKQKFSYQVKLYYIILSGNEELSVSSKNITNYIQWDKQTDRLPIPSQSSITGVGDEAFETALLGIQSLSLQLNQEHWYVSWHTALIPYEYDPYTGKYTFMYDLYFKQWKEDMKKESFNPKQSFASSKKPGWADFSSRVLLIQLKNAWIENLNTNGVVYAQGKNPNNECDQSIVSKAIKLHPLSSTIEEALTKYSEEELEQLILQYKASNQRKKNEKK